MNSLNTWENETAPLFRATHLNLEVFAEAEVVGYTIKACAEEDFSEHVAPREHDHGPFIERTLSTL